jgi:type I restriction enzyme R subunit
VAFNENTRVKIPAILYLTRLGYEYVSLKNANWDEDANIFTEIFVNSIKRINRSQETLKSADKNSLDYIESNDDLDSIAAEQSPISGIYCSHKSIDAQKLINELKDLFDYDDLGRAFYNRIITDSGIKLIDFTNFENNSFHVCTELPCKNGDDEFRPDITILVNGMPLVFIEVKKPNNKDGILAERNRINIRFQNKKFKRFLNATQFMIFSNNMEYDDESVVPVQGAFYAAVSATDAVFNCFREEDKEIFNRIKPVDNDTEDFILLDNNLAAIKNSPEYLLNKEVQKPTNQIISSLLSMERLKFILKYGLVYVDAAEGLSKHIMRYPQLFATKAIENAINNGVKKGIIWHTQGSGKTALAFFNVAYLIACFQKKKTVPKFYFIVDRIDLMTQARDEFSSRGLHVITVNRKEDFKNNIKAVGAIKNPDGKNEITVVNIQKFSEDSRVVAQSDYDINTQRIYFLDEVHRSYNPHGSFLANLFSSDKNAIYIGLTGTPLLNKKLKPVEGGKSIEYNSKDIFGDYIHKYYYDLSIKDGYTLKLIREGIETTYKTQLKEILDEIELLHGSANKRLVYAHENYVNPLADYIINDIKKSKNRLEDDSIGAMVVCDTSDQAKKLFEIVNKKYPEIPSALILHDVDDKDTRKNNRDNFKLGKIDLLIVFNMLLTGFDAKRLKKLYLNRVVKDHNLLQTLTRVNRPYKQFRYGYVVDFADIRREFDKTNAAYFRELQEEIGDEWEQYSSLFKSAEEIEKEIAEIKEKLFLYDTQNAENFSEQINAVNDKAELLELQRALENAKVLGNLIRLYDHSDLADKLNFVKLKELLGELTNRIALINQKEALENDTDNTNLINLALEEIIFKFVKVSEKELQLGIVDDFKQQVQKTREAMQDNFDHEDAVYISLYKELERIFKKKKLSEMTTEDLDANIILLKSIYDQITEQNRRDNLLKAKYKHDVKFARIHKRLIEKKIPEWNNREMSINQALLGIKDITDSQLLLNHNLLDNEAFFAKNIQPSIITQFKNEKLVLDADTAVQIDGLIVAEYMNEYRSGAA